MTRNKERNRQEADRRKDQLIQAGFELFSRYGIDAVSLSAVADKAGVGGSTMYKYFQNKVNLVVAISGRIWGDVWNDTLNTQRTQLEQMNPCQLFEYYADCIISLYKQHPEMLRFSADYKTYIRRADASDEMLSEHLDPLKPIAALYHKSYDAAAEKGLVRTDVSEARMFSFTSMTMLAMAERYAQGIVWTENADIDHTKDLESLKEMLSTWMKG